MACQIITTNGAVFALWGKPTTEDFDRVKAALLTAAAECGHPVLYVTRVPPKAPPPDGAARVRLDELMPSIVQLCSSYHVVLEGEGFGAAIKRGILTGLFQLSWRRRTFFVHATMNEIASNVSAGERPALHAILDAARAQDLLAGPLSAHLSPASL